MFNLIKKWLKCREDEHDFRERARLCKPCDEFCGNDLCSKVGCLNTDMQTNTTRLKLLTIRLEDTGYVFITEHKDEPQPVNNVVNINDFRK